MASGGMPRASGGPVLPARCVLRDLLLRSALLSRCPLRSSRRDPRSVVASRALLARSLARRAPRPPCVCARCCCCLRRGARVPTEELGLYSRLLATVSDASLSSVSSRFHRWNLFSSSKIDDLQAISSTILQKHPKQNKVFQSSL